MRLIAWNANRNNRKRTMSQDLELLAPLHPDVVVLSETLTVANEAAWSWRAAGGWPQLAVWLRKGYRLKNKDEADPNSAQAALLEIDGPVRFKLCAAWPVTEKSTGEYNHILMRMLERFGDALRTGPAILAGDLNSSTRVIAQKQAHPRFVKRMKELGLESAYHFQRGIKHGDECEMSYVHGKKAPKSFVIDYAFVSAPLVRAANCSLPQTEAWGKLSDHFPLILDIPNAAFTESGA